MQTFLISAGTVTLGEIGDKTQLLALLLAARFRKPWPIALGILVATLVNHAASAWLAWRSRASCRLTSCAGWWLSASSPWRCGRSSPTNLTQATRSCPPTVRSRPPPLPSSGRNRRQDPDRHGAARRQILALVAGGGRHHAGMLIADLPVIWLGSRFAGRLNLQYARFAAAAVFLVLACGPPSTVLSLALAVDARPALGSRPSRRYDGNATWSKVWAGSASACSGWRC
jgi:putative Ca2+/H+ antiporter (TMEM165/GDT1 family)